MVFSFLYLAFRAVLGALVRSRRGLDVKDIELLVLRHELEVLRRQVARPKVGAAIGPCWQRRRVICHAARAALVWSRRGRCFVGIERSSAGSGDSRPDGVGGRRWLPRFGNSCYGSRGRTRAGATGGSAVSWASSASGYRRRASAVCSPGRG